MKTEGTRPALPFRTARPVVGMIHLPPLPGAPRHARPMAEILEDAAADARVLADCGFAGVLVENFGDVPFHADAVPPETVAALTLAVARVRDVAGSVPVGVNVLRNDARTALAIAAAAGGAFVRVNVHAGTMWTDQGPIVGRAAETLRARAVLAPGCAILADVHVKHAIPAPGESLEDAARDTWYRGLADVLVISGRGTGRATDPTRVRRAAEAVPGAPVWVGSGVTTSSLEELWPLASGFIVGSDLMENGRAGGRVERARAESFMAAVQRLAGRG